MFKFLCHINLIYKMLVFIIPAYFIIPQFSCPTNHPVGLRHSPTLFSAPSNAALPDRHTVHIPNINLLKLII
jgi:hypothetical protein